MLGYGFHINQLGSGGSSPPPAAPSLSNPQFAAMNTAVTNDVADDGFSWAQASPLVTDQYGNIIALAQRDNSSTKRHFYVWRNASGAVWTDNAANTGSDGQPGEAFFERGCHVYDPAQSCIHTLWITLNPGDGGVIYRRYDVARTGQDITSITRTSGVSVVLDGSNVAEAYTHPILLHLSDAAYGAHGALVACWSAHKSGKNEVRSARCVLGSSATTGGTAANWVHLGVASSDTMGIAPDTASYTALAANSNPGVVYAALSRKSSGDLYLLYHDGGNVPLTGAWRWRRMAWSSSAHDWSNGLTADTLITNVQRAGTDSGYSLKGQLGTAWHEDTAHDRMVVGLATWKDDTNGDTWGYVGVNADDGLTALVDVYSANGAHSFAPTGDVCYDATSARIVASWLGSADNAAYVRLYDGLASAGSAIQAFSAQPIDIPLLYAGGRLGAKLAMLFRDRTDQSGAPRFRGWYGTLDWS